VRRLGLAVLLAAALAAPAPAADWGLITPGVSTMETVRARYGRPTKTEAQKVEGYDATEWTYAGDLAPTGMVQMIVDFGLLTAAGFKKEVVRSFRLDPKPGAFPKKLVVDGWGVPTKAGPDGAFEVFYYDSGLLVYFAKDDPDARTMMFTVPQPTVATPTQR
jgi:hypothetical protein